MTIGQKPRASRAIAKIYERDMDLVLLEEIESSAEFRAWLVARVFSRDCHLKYIATRHRRKIHSDPLSPTEARAVADRVRSYRTAGDLAPTPAAHPAAAA